MSSAFLPTQAGSRAADHSPVAGRASSPQKLKLIRDLVLMSQLADVEAVRFVSQRGPELILVGPAAENGSGIQPDDWLTIIRALGQFGPPGVSIDPGPSSEAMVVRYFGGIQQTHLGSVFFEADRTLKMLSTGYNNLDCSKVSLLPASSSSELEMLEREFLRNQVAGPAGWHRFWFDLTTDPVEMSSDHRSALIPARRLFVDEQAIGLATASLGSGKQFAEQISAQFPDLRQKIPAFAELQRHAGLWRLAGWIVDQHIPIDLRWLDAAPDPASTAVSTPTITVTRSSIAGRSYLRVGIFGGVDFRKPNSYKQIPGQSDLLSAAEQTDQKRSAWDFQYQGQAYRAIRLRYQKAGSLPAAPRISAPMWDRPAWTTPPVLRWVLPVPTLGEASAELAGRVGGCGRITPDQVVLRGQAYIWDNTKEKEDLAFDRIPLGLKGNDTLKPLTVFVIHNRNQVEVGRYSVSGQPAYRESLDVAIFYWPSGECVGTINIDGGPPPESRIVQYVPGYGTSVKLADWVTGLRKENGR